MKVDRIGMKAVRFRYRNWRGEESIRTAVPISIDFGTTEYHPEPQWIMSAYDEDKQAHRDFALADCDFAFRSKNFREAQSDG